MRALVWLFRAFVFFVLFAFALNNQQVVTVNGFFGIGWQTPLVMAVLVAFGAGCAIGVLAMVPAWWSHRRKAQKAAAEAPAAAATPRTDEAHAEPVLLQPPREAL